jgi:hypothetical protein
MRSKVVFTTAILVAGSMLSASAPATSVVVGHSLDPAPQSRMEGNQAIDDAAAAALIGAISAQFSERRVEIKLDSVNATPAGLIQRDIRGAGRLQIGQDDTWIPFRFQALYDTEQASVGYPELTLGSDEPGNVLPTDASIAKRLVAEVDARLRDEFAGQPASFAMDSVRVQPAGTRYLRLQAIGVAQFGDEGDADAGVRALYDVRTGDWLQLEYELGATANRDVATDTIALR